MLVKEDIKSILSEYKELVDLELIALLKKENLVNASKTSLLDSIRYSVLNGGKRLRPILSLITAEAVLKSEDKLEFTKNPASGLAQAIELVHCGSLIHDDLPCMDNDELRRGIATNHIQYGEAMALLAGDTLISYPIEVLLTQTPVNYQYNLNKIQLEFIQAIRDMIAGQALDLYYSEHESLELSENDKEKISNKTIEDLQEMQSLKTGALLKASIKLAAIVAGASNEQTFSLSNYAKNLGLAFQVVDDILDHSSSTEELGKKAGKDQSQNKFTFVQQYGIDGAKQLAQELIDGAKKNIESIDIYTDKLNLIADYVLLRTN